MTTQDNRPTGYLGRRKASPSALAIVVAMHAAAVVAALLAKGMVPLPVINESIDTFDVVPDPPPPPAEEVDPPPEVPVPTLPVTTLRDPLPGEAVTPVEPWRPVDLPRGPGRPAVEPPPPPPPEPVFVEARIDPSAMAAMQPGYPAALLRRGLEGEATVRVRIGTDGRVTAVERVAADHDAFFEATREQALRRWRFIPATRDGRPVPSWQQQTVVFRITD